jgi:hypothetical protein
VEVIDDELPPLVNERQTSAKLISYDSDSGSDREPTPKGHDLEELD